MVHVAPERPGSDAPTAAPPAGVVGSATTSTTTPPTPIAPTTPAEPQGARRTNVLVALGYLLAAGVVTCRLWAAPNSTELTHNRADQVFFEWLLGYVSHAVTHGDNPLWTSMLNAPLGVNIAANTSITVLAVLLMPVTILAGPSVAFVTAITLNLAGSAYAWFWLFSRHVARTRTAAIAGGAFGGFAPGMIAHANGHLNFTACWLLPVLIWHLIRLTRPVRGRGRTIRDGALLGVLAAVQYSLCAETLFFLAMAVVVFVVAWTVQRPRAAMSIAAIARYRVIVAIVVGAALLAYPVWLQVAGPEAYHGSGFTHLGVWENITSFAAFPPQSLAGAAGWWTGSALNYGERDTFFGPVLCAALLVAVVVMNRRPAARRGDAGRSRPEVLALTVTAAAIAVVALGPRLQVGAWHSPIPLPWGAVDRLPFFDSALPGRSALLLIPIVALFIVAVVDHLLARPRRHATRRIAALVAVAAFVPILPVPISTSPRAALPTFISAGMWRAYLPPGATVVSIPPSSWDSSDAQRWQTATGYAFPVEGGYFLGPGNDGRSSIGPLSRPTSTLLTAVARDGARPTITDADRSAARADLIYWHAGLVVLPDPTPGIDHAWAGRHDQLLKVGTELFGTPTRVADVWLWRFSH
ncbi:MAG TPA: DUF2079 domain-containing protein [Micromonosporaceae bacterium]|nr:DUF2079 domain-containing protein [Micromonosporaceae bacterium]